LRLAVPLAADTYGAYQSSLAVLVRMRDLALLASAIRAALWLRRDGATGMLARMLVAASLAAWIAYLAGGTWWHYHRYPDRALAFAKVWSRYAWVEDTESFRVYARRNARAARLTSVR
jgi:hypothetical protein